MHDLSSPDTLFQMFKAAVPPIVCGSRQEHLLAQLTVDLGGKRSVFSVFRVTRIEQYECAGLGVRSGIH